MSEPEGAAQGEREHSGFRSRAEVRPAGEPGVAGLYAGPYTATPSAW
jgi:hypothetical protein